MAHVLSKYDRVLRNKEYVSKALIAISVLLYSYKITYPILKMGYHFCARSVTTSRFFEFADEQRPPASHLSLQPQFDVHFLCRLYRLIRLMIPHWYCLESRLLLMHTAALFSRTLLSILVAAMEGLMVEYIVKKDVQNFILMLLKWLAIALPATFVNSAIRYLESKLALSFRCRLVNECYRLYMNEYNTYYKMSQLDSRIDNVDHLLTEDINSFCISVAHLYSHITKPLFDLALIAFALASTSRNMGARAISGPLLATIVIGVSGVILRIVSPKFGAMVAAEAHQNAYLSHVHNRIINNAEEIAFYKGHKVELYHLKKAYSSLVNQKNRIFLQRLWFVILEQFLMKYVWSGTGMIVVSLPILITSRQIGEDGKEISSSLRLNENETAISRRTRYFTTARNLLLSGGDAVERLMSSYKEIVELAGYTYRVSHMLQVFQDVTDGIYVRKNIHCSSSSISRQVTDSSSQPPPLLRPSHLPVKGVMEERPDGKSISLRDVWVVTPNGDVLIKGISFTITAGSHLLITGPNGCGKSSLFRVISGLWPLHKGVIVKPFNCSLFYIPQRPYMTLGTLREQLIYPDTTKEMMEKGRTDQELIICLEKVQLSYLLSREGGWDANADWKDIFSGGEKQRMAIARLFYHKPLFALLDECTSAVSTDIEDYIYEEAKSLGITLLTIAHRQSIWKFHEQVLNFDGAGGWSVSPLKLELKNDQHS